VDLSKVKILIMDEVDRMFHMGQTPDIKTIFLNLPKPKSTDPNQRMQVMMFTATLMGKSINLVARFAPRHERIDLNWNLKAPKSVRQVVYEVTHRRKRALLTYLLRRKGSLKGKKVLVFCRTRLRVVNLTEHLKSQGFQLESIFKSQSLATRQKNIDLFRDNHIKLLISTELMARGIDIPDLEVVINFDVPHEPEEYIHRIGRTGRVGRDGLAITFVAKKSFLVKIGRQITEINEKEFIKKIQDLMEKRILISKIPGP